MHPPQPHRALDHSGRVPRVVRGYVLLPVVLAMTLIADIAFLLNTKSPMQVHQVASQRQAELSPEIMENLPLLTKALRFVGHPQTRNRGTIGGSLANADPSAEIPLVATALDAILESVGPGGKVERKPEDFGCFL